MEPEHRRRHFRLHRLHRAESVANDRRPALRYGLRDGFRSIGDLQSGRGLRACSGNLCQPCHFFHERNRPAVLFTEHPGHARCTGLLRQRAVRTLRSVHAVQFRLCVCGRAGLRRDLGAHLHRRHRHTYLYGGHIRCCHRHHQHHGEHGDDHRRTARHHRNHRVGGWLGIVGRLLLHLPAEIDCGNACQRQDFGHHHPGRDADSANHRHRHQQQHHHRFDPGLPVHRSDRHFGGQHRKGYSLLPRRGFGLCDLPADQLQSSSHQSDRLIRYRASHLLEPGQDHHSRHSQQLRLVLSSRPVAVPRACRIACGHGWLHGEIALRAELDGDGPAGQRTFTSAPPPS